MLSCFSQGYVLEHFLRLDTEQHDLWLPALQLLTDCQALSLKLPVAESRTRLAYLSDRDAEAIGLFTAAPCKLIGTTGNCFTIFMPTEEVLEFNLTGVDRRCTPWSVLTLAPHAEFEMSLPDDTHLLVIKINASGLCCADMASENKKTGLEQLLGNFLLESCFFHSCRDAKQHLQLLYQQILKLKTDKAPCTAAARLPDKLAISKDRRLNKALQLMMTIAATDQSVGHIARCAGLSLRNFHYLMKKYTGQSPYQYMRNRRLIQAREAIIRSGAAGVPISELAAECGFSHAGRFAHYYHQLFGEYPNETRRALQQLQRLQNVDEGIRRSKTLADQYWLTSSAALNSKPFQQSHPCNL